jgi:hypothetical protein
MHAALAAAEAYRSPVTECILDALMMWARSGLQAPYEIVLPPDLYRRFESEALVRWARATAPTGDAIVIQGPSGPVRIAKEQR